MANISAVVLSKNEENNIVDCLESIEWVDEVIVVDDNSEDRTAELAKKKGATIYKRSLDGDFASQRNFALRQAQGNWVLFVDADERVSEALASEIKNQIPASPTDRSKIKNNYDGYFIKRKDFMWGKELKHGETGNIKLLRLAKKNSGKWEGKVHEEWKVKGNIGQLKNPLFHYPHQSITEFLGEINFYTNIRAKELYGKGVRVNLVSIIAYPKAKFFLNYFLRRGFFDGIPGFLVAIFMSFHSFLVRGKLWQLQQK